MTKKDDAAEKLRQFREFADDARKSAAKTADPEMKERFRQLAEAWEQLIGEIEGKR